MVLIQGMAVAAPKKAPAKPAPAATQRELWVPTEHLESVLKKMPRAVMLTPEQYETLLLDSQLAVPDPKGEKKLLPPVQATIRDAKVSGTIATGGDVVTMAADYVVESFTDDWAEIPLSLPRASMASIEVDAVSALRVMPPQKGKQALPILVVKGKGKHAVKAVFHIPVKRSPTGNSIVIAPPGTPAASLNLKFPDGAELDSALPFVVSEDQPNLAKFVLSAQSKSEFEIRWIARNVATIPDAAIFQNCQYLYSIDSTRVQADLGFVLNSNLTKLPNRFEIKMADDVRVLSVEGAELLRWTRLSGGTIEVILVAGDRDVTDLRVLAEADVKIEDDASDAVIELPIADVLGIHRASGTMALIGADDVRVKNIATGSLTAPIPDDVEGVIANDPNYVASFRFPAASGATEVTLSKIGEKFKAQMDTLIAMERESIQLTRTLNVIPDEGRTFEIDFDLPDGEELLDVNAGGRSDFSWVRGEGNSIRLAWKAGLSAGNGDSLTITSRRDPEGWFALGNEAMELNFTSATINGAEALSGYVAVSFDESFRVETATADGLDPRDGRTTPITGTLAWFRLSDFDLALNASRRATEIEAVHTAYALPLASNLEIEGQIDLGIRYTPIGEVGIVFPVEVAAQVRFESPLISEKNLNEETGEWTLDFHDELIGPQRFRYRMSLPFEVEEVGKDSDQKRFEIGLPVVKVPAAKRLRGDWVLEANTDTELTFEASGLDAVDSLRVPAVSGYQPRHRVIAAYRYRGDAWSLKLAGTRHAHEDLVSTVIDDLRLDTVVSTDGDERHQAMMNLRTTGEQFLEIGLPKDSVLWTVKVDGDTVKPIRAAPGTIRVQLPAHENANARAISVKLIYQTPGRKWTGSGREKLQPIRVADRIPIMRTKWFLHLPEGYDYQKFESNLGEEFEVVDRTLLGYAGDELKEMLARPMGALMIAKNESADESIREVLSSAASQPEAIVDQNGTEILIDSLPADIQEQIVMTQGEIAEISGSGLLAVDQSGRFYPENEEAEEAGIPGIASRYVIRLQERVKKADEAALRASQLMADNDLEGAIEQYRAGIDLLPVANITQSRRDAYLKQYVNGTVRLAEQRVEEARYGDAANLLTRVLNPQTDPGNFEARRLLERLQDPEWYSPALTPVQLDKVRKVEYGLKVAQGHLDLGDFEGAERQYLAAISQDPYNSAARRGLETVEQERLKYYDTARDQTRATFMRKIAEGWEMPADSGLDDRVESRLKTIILPSVEFVDTPISDALQFLQQRSVELDMYETDPTRKGLNFILDENETQLGNGAAPSGWKNNSQGEGGDPKITLRLQNIPLSDALRYTLSLAGMEYKINSGQVQVVPQAGYREPELVTRSYRVPSNFVSMGDVANQGNAGVDAFADPSDSGGIASARDVLESQGVTFPSGADVAFDSASGKLTVRTTEDQIELTEILLDSMTGSDLSGRVNDNFSGALGATDVETDRIMLNEQKVKKIIIPTVEFVNTPLKDALEFLQQRSVELDTNETDPSRKGINFVIDSGMNGAAAAPAAGGGFDASGGDVGDTRITLRLQNVPLLEALRYTTSLAQMKYKVEPNAIVILPLSRPDSSLYTNVYTVPPTFLTAGGSSGVGGGGTAAADPFADPVEAGGGVAGGRMSAQEVLEAAGVTFPPGGSASYNPRTSQLIIRTTQDQMELAEIFQDTLIVASNPDDAMLGRANGGFAAERLSEPGAFPVTPATPTQGDQFEYPTEYNPPEIPNQVGNQMKQFFGQKAIDQLNPNWRKVPVLDQVPTIGRLFKSDEVVITENRIELGKMQINDLDLQGKTVKEALGLIREKTLADGAAAPPVGAHRGTSRSKLVKFIYQEPEKMEPSGVDPAIKNKLDLKLSNVTVLEALDQISEASDTHFRVTPDGIAFAPKQVTLEPMQTIFIELPESEFTMADGNGGSLPAHARYVLRDAGIKFPSGASAAYNPATGRLAVRNTRPNLEAIASYYAAFLNVEARQAHAASRAEMFEREFLGGAADLKGFDLADIGRLPIDFVLPESGRSYSFTGLVAPESIEFRFVNWERQIRFAWIWILVGGLAYWFGAYKRFKKPIFIGLLGVVTLTFAPLVLSQSLLAFCNALLIGWLVAAGIWVVWRLSHVGETREVSV